jgi:hypothetical protein
LRHTVSLLALLCLLFLVASPAEGGSSRPGACSTHDYSYAGLESDTTAHGISATISALERPIVSDGHVGGWIGVGGTKLGPGGTDEWLQVGLASFSPDSTIRLYYELQPPNNADTHYVELDTDVQPGTKYNLAVLEMAGRDSWWRVWVNGKPATAPIHLVGSHGHWYPQAIGENWNGANGTCNAYAYRFTDVRLARSNGGDWKPLGGRQLYQDAGYRVVQTSRVPSTFVASSVG